MTARPTENRDANLAELAALAHDLALDTLTDTEWEHTRGALRRHQATVNTNPVATAAFNRTTARIEQRTGVLREHRKARSLTQAEVGKLLGMDQSEVSRLEQRTDLLLSTLKRYVAATGGVLHLVVTYPDTAPVDVELSDPRREAAGR